MKALTVYQPWASLIAVRAKPYEFRGWAAPKAVRGQRIATHASARKIVPAEVQWIIEQLEGETPWAVCLRPDLALPLLKRVLGEPDILPRSAIVCTAVLGEPVNALDIVHEFGRPVNDSQRREHANWAWPLTDIEQLHPPIEAKGMQGFWTAPQLVSA